MSKRKTNDKRVEGLAPDMTVGIAAKQALYARFQAVYAALDSAGQPGSDPEPVHALRVATRRASAALRVFAEWLPSKAERQCRHRLRDLRRAAGPAREADVFIAALDDWTSKSSKRPMAAIYFLYGHALAERRTAQPNLAQTMAKALADWAFMDRCPTKAVGGKAPLGRVARIVCDKLTRDFHRAIEECDFDDAARLHALRIAGKRLRYAYELLAPALPTDLHASLYEPLVELQGMLGAAHDHTQTIDRLDKLLESASQANLRILESLKPGIDAFRQSQRRQFVSCRTAFATWREKWSARATQPIAQ